MDDFKKVNDQFGHPVGDRVLQSVTQLIMENKRKTDVFGRWGGEEFLIICRESDEKAAKKVAEKFRDILDRHNFEGVGHQSASFGVAQFTQDDTVEQVIKRADEALYTAKHNGKNRVEVY